MYSAWTELKRSFISYLRQCDQMLELQVVKISLIVAQNLGTVVWRYKVTFFKIAQKVATCLGYFCNKISRQNLSKTAQSGHIGVQ